VRGPLRGLTGTVSAQMLDLVLNGRRFGTIDVGLDATRGHWQSACDGLGWDRAAARHRGAEVGWPFTLAAEWRETRLGHLIQPGPMSGSSAPEPRTRAVG
jgi:hypothetical protein